MNKSRKEQVFAIDLLIWSRFRSSLKKIEQTVAGLSAIGVLDKE